MLKTRLGAMLFLEYFTWGAWYVTLGTWLSTALNFSGQQIGWVAGTTALGAIIAPFSLGIVADKSIATEKLLALLHGIGAILLYVASTQQSFGVIFTLILLYSMAFMPTIALTNSLCFRHIASPEREFGAIRALGTLGWIVAGLLIGGSSLDATAVPMRFAALSSVLMALYCLTLPKTPPLLGGGSGGISAPLKALGVLKARPIAIFAAASFLICIPLQTYYAFTNLFLNEVGVPNAAARMSAGQMSELFCMLLIPWFFRRLGVKYMLLTGMLAWVARYAFFALGDAGPNMWMFWAGILLHGICYDFFFVVGQIYIDASAPPELRAATQGLITLITYGIGMFVGSYLAGIVVDLAANPAAHSHDWTRVWTLAAAFAAGVAILFALLFKAPDKTGALAAERG